MVAALLCKLFAFNTLVTSVVVVVSQQHKDFIMNVCKFMGMQKLLFNLNALNGNTRNRFIRSCLAYPPVYVGVGMFLVYPSAEL